MQSSKTEMPPSKTEMLQRRIKDITLKKRCQRHVFQRQRHQRRLFKDKDAKDVLDVFLMFFGEGLPLWGISSLHCHTTVGRKVALQFQISTHVGKSDPIRSRRRGSASQPNLSRYIFYTMHTSQGA